MVKYSSKIKKIVSSLFFRVVLCMFLLVCGAMFVRFSNSMVSLAQSENVSKNEDIISSDESVNLDTSDLIYVDLSKSNDTITNDSFYHQVYPENWLEEFNEKVALLQEIFPSGKYWNHMGQNASNPGETNNIYCVTDIPCNHNIYGELYCNAHYGKSNDVYPYYATCSQCRGFASLLSDIIFGEDAPVRYFEDYDELRIGDQARIDGDFHSVFIIDKTDEYVIVAECNADLQTCQINWGRKILRQDLNGWYITRWD